MRGEHPDKSDQVVLSAGSSPLARGTRQNLSPKNLNVRIIPACAGNTRSDQRADAATPDHPRLRGEHRDVERLDLYRRGSSPLARGTPESLGHAPTRRRIIPACAGNTGVGWLRHYRGPDHPRLRGEHPIASLIQPMMEGSSPLARGTHRKNMPDILSLRIIPACAGNT